MLLPSFCPLLVAGKALGHPSRLSCSVPGRRRSSVQFEPVTSANQLRGTPAPSPAHSNWLPPGRRRCAVPVERHRSRSNDPCPLSFPDGRSVFTFLPSQMATCVLVARGWRCLCIATCSDIRLRHPHSRTLTSPRQHTMLINTRGDPLK